MKPFHYFAPTEVFFGKGEEENVGGFKKLGKEDVLAIYRMANK